MAPKKGHGNNKAPIEPAEFRKKKKFEPDGFVDVFWAILFIINVLMMIGYVAYATTSGQVSWALNVLNSDETVELLQGNFAKASVNPDATSVVLISLSLVFSAVYACLWLMAIQSYPEEVVAGSFYFYAALMILMGLICLGGGDAIGGIIMIVFGLICCCIPMCAKEQLKFTARIVKGVSNVYSGRKHIFLVAILCIILQVCWIAIVFTAFIPVAGFEAEDNRKAEEAEAAGEEPPPSSGAGIAGIGLIFCYYWGIQVFSNILHVACSGVMARFYFDKQTDNSVSISTSHAFTYYLGPIALGSFLIAIIQTLRYLAEQMARKKEGGRGGGNAAEQVLACVAVCCLRCLERLMELFNNYCFIITAIYGTSFCTSAGKVINLLIHDGFKVLVQNSWVGIVCIAANIFGSLMICGIVALLAAGMLLPAGYIQLCAFSAFFMCFAVMLIVSRIFESGADTLVVCYIEEPKKAQSSAPEIAECFGEVSPLDY